MAMGGLLHDCTGKSTLIDSTRNIQRFEAKFTRGGIINLHNYPVWDMQNPRAMMEVNHQHRFSLNVWAGIIGNHLVGPVVLPERLRRGISQLLAAVVYAEPIPDVQTLEQHIRAACYAIRMQPGISELVRQSPLRIASTSSFRQREFSKKVNYKCFMQPIEWDPATNPAQHLAISGMRQKNGIPNGINGGILNVSPTRFGGDHDSSTEGKHHEEEYQRTQGKNGEEENEELVLPILLLLLFQA
ncbi:hypothetical protein ANN_19382 [Periplaneta americana]|uniref:Uncharacterized protein n=1 Tax=Periplaneta americana TaxID=6978 RepID=A0ABQ8SAN7_PERAM|nr:hypothetical protein ANN_19382 [Periplaneta americana]